MHKNSVVLIHGNSSSAAVFEDYISNSKTEYAKLAIDLLGHGKNEVNFDTENHEDFSFAAQKKFLLQELSKVEGKILLVGNSLGGHLAIEVAPHLAKISGLVIMGTPPVKKPINFEEAFNPVPELNTYLTEHPSDEELKKTSEVALVNTAFRDLIITDFKNANPLVRKATRIDLTQNQLDNQLGIFTKLRIPKYILAGDRDPSVNFKYLEMVCQMSCDSCSLISLQSCGHFPSIDVPEKFRAHIDAIAKKVLS